MSKATFPLYGRASDLRTYSLNGGCIGQNVLDHVYKGKLPDTTWFILGTALHTGFEAAILEDLSLEDMLTFVEKSIKKAIKQAKKDYDGTFEGSVIQSASTRSKRTRDTMYQDAERIGTKWWNNVMPDGNDRMFSYERYDWPPKVEVNIALDKKNPAKRLFTQADAVFKGGPFGAEVAIVDWKTGGTKHAAPSQLHTYAYGGRKEGWFPKDQEGLVGWFHHADHNTRQLVNDYIGDEIVEAWIAQTYTNKRNMIDNGTVVFSPDWFCKTCRAKEKCPIVGQGDYQEVVTKLQGATELLTPREE